MYERSTIHSRQEKRQKVHASAKASDSKGMGTDWQWSRGCVTKTLALKNLGVARSTYYGWIYQHKKSCSRGCVSGLGTNDVNF